MFKLSWGLDMETTVNINNKVVKVVYIKRIKSFQITHIGDKPVHEVHIDIFDIVNKQIKFQRLKYEA